MNWRKALLCLLAVCALSISCAAFDGEEETDSLYDYLPADAAARVREAKTAAGYDLNSGISTILETAWSAMGGIFKSGVQTAASMLAICLICSLVSICLGDKSAIGASAISCASVGAVFAVGAAALSGTLAQMTELLNELNLFSKALMPTLTAAGVAAGAGGAAVARQSAAMLFADLLITLLTRAFIPLTYAALALRGVGILSQNAFFTRASAFCKNTVSLAVRTLLTLYFGYISVVGLVGGAADTLAKRAAKTAISAGIPLVGGALTDAAEAIYAGGALVKNTLGVFGLIAVMSCAILPLLSAGGAYLALRAGAALAQNLQDTGGREAIDAVADAVSMVFAMCAGATALILLTVIVCMK